MKRIVFFAFITFSIFLHNSARSEEAEVQCNYETRKMGERRMGRAIAKPITTRVIDGFHYRSTHPTATINPFHPHEKNLTPYFTYSINRL